MQFLFMKKGRSLLVIFLLLASPGFWSIGKALPIIVGEWYKSPGYAATKMSSIFSPESRAKLDSLKWFINPNEKSNLSSRLLYNNGIFIVDQVFDYLSFLSPRIYFLSGDGTQFSPSDTSPIFPILFPFFVFGAANFIKRNKKNPLYFFLLAFPAYVTGQKNFAFLFPVFFMYIYLSSIGIERLYEKK